MQSVYVFCSRNRFHSFEQMREYIDPSYTEDGDSIESVFMREVGLTDYEPGCIEAILSVDATIVPLQRLLSEASYADQWLSDVAEQQMADAAICVFAPNQIASPEYCSLQYIGKFWYVVE